MPTPDPELSAIRGAYDALVERATAGAVTRLAPETLAWGVEPAGALSCFIDYPIASIEPPLDALREAADEATRCFIGCAAAETGDGLSRHSLESALRARFGHVCGFSFGTARAAVVAPLEPSAGAGPLRTFADEAPPMRIQGWLFVAGDRPVDGVIAPCWLDATGDDPRALRRAAERSEHLAREVEALRASTSWRLTAPLRGIATAGKAMAHRTPSGLRRMLRAARPTASLSAAQSPDTTAARPAPTPHLPLHSVGGLPEFRVHRQRHASELAMRVRRERELADLGESFTVRGYCVVCARREDFAVDMLYGSRDADGRRLPNWRERVVCPGCGLNNRVRASIHLLRQLFAPTRDRRIYATEQTTPLFAWLEREYPHAVGSEYLGDKVPFGATWQSPHGGAIRNESLLALSFPDASFDFIVSFDVFEHMPDYRRAFAECLRCLAPGGGLLFSVPFAADAEDNIVRARIGPDGALEHLLPPEYHGDPVNDAGCLCFYHFGWAMLDELRAAGFTDAAAHLYWSEAFGYLGHEQILFSARKPGRLASEAP